MPDGQADVAVSIHVIEHFYQWEAQDVITEWMRVLKPGGKLILECPSMDKVLSYVAGRIHAKMPIAPFMGWFSFWGDPKHKSPDMCHKWGYTYLMLKQLLETCGMVNVTSEKARYHFPERDMRVVSYKPSTT